jgi:D-glycero-alpha-D-manno-heptose-7-phosphate kinase
MIITKTPFRTSLVGGGLDIKSFYKYYNGKVASTTIDKYIYVVVKNN